MREIRLLTNRLLSGCFYGFRYMLYTQTKTTSATLSLISHRTRKLTRPCRESPKKVAHNCQIIFIIIMKKYSEIRMTSSFTTRSLVFLGLIVISGKLIRAAPTTCESLKHLRCWQDQRSGTITAVLNLSATSFARSR